MTSPAPSPVPPARPRLVLLHGWGLGADMWDALAARLPDFTLERWDRGYFGARVETAIDGPTVLVGHSLGALLLASGGWPCPLVAINGFDRFAGPGGVAPRVVARMRQKLAETPEAVLADFRARCGAGTPPPLRNAGQLAEDLALLARETPLPATASQVLVLQGGADPILPAPLRAGVFAGAAHHTLAEGGHMLPQTAPDWCADHIRAFVEELAW